jgi:1-acyl-sn-glycerol-3-phosphate acyltransferase
MRATQPKKHRPENRPIIRLLQAVNVCFARIYHRLEIRSAQSLPRDGPAILVSNHTSGLDPMLIQSVCPRLITWMMAGEYMHIPVLRRVFKTLGVIPVARSGRDLTSTRAAIRALHDGAVLGVFPEGRIENSRQLLPFQTGVALMAIKTGVPVFPVYLDGSQRGREIAASVLLPGVSSIAFGPEVVFDRTSTSKEALEAVTQKIVKAVADLRDKCR